MVTTWNGTLGGWHLSNSNLTASSPNVNDSTRPINSILGAPSIPAVSKVYWEVTVTGAAIQTAFVVGIGTSNVANGANLSNTNVAAEGSGVIPSRFIHQSYNLTQTIDGNVVYDPQGNATYSKDHPGALAAPNQWFDGTVLGFALDRSGSTATMQMYVNGVAKGSNWVVGNSSNSGLKSATIFPLMASWYKSGPVGTINGGTNGFKYAIPAGFTALDKWSVTPPTGGPSSITVTTSPSGTIQSGSPYSIIGNSPDNAFSATANLLFSNNQTSGAIGFQGAGAGVLSNSNKTVTWSGLTSGLLEPHSAYVLDSFYGVQGGPTSFTIATGGGGPTTRTLAVNDASIFYNENVWYGDTGRGGSVSRTCWNMGAYFRVRFTASASPTWTVIGTATGPIQLNYILNGVQHTAVSSTGSLTITGLAASATNDLTVMYGYDSGNLARWTITSIVMDIGSVPLTKPNPQQLMLWYGDSITQGLFVQALQTYAYLVTSGIGGYDYADSSASGSSWTIPGEAAWSGGLFPVSGIARWSVIDDPSGTPISVLDSASQISGYGSTGTGPAVVSTNMGTNDALRGTPAATVQAQATAYFIALRAAIPASCLSVCFIPFGLYNTTQYPTGPAIIAAIKAAISAANASGAKVSTVDLGANVSSNLISSNLTSDGVHPTVAGHTYLAGLIKPLVQNIIQPQNTPPPQTGLIGVPLLGWGCQLTYANQGPTRVAQDWNYFTANFCVPRNLLLYTSYWGNIGQTNFSWSQETKQWAADPSLNGTNTGKQCVPIMGSSSTTADNGLNFTNSASGAMDSYFTGIVNYWKAINWRAVVHRWDYEDNYPTCNSGVSAKPGYNNRVPAGPNNIYTPWWADGKNNGAIVSINTAAANSDAAAAAPFAAKYIPAWRRAALKQHQAAQGSSTTWYMGWGPTIHNTDVFDMRRIYPDSVLSDGNGKQVDASLPDLYCENCWGYATQNKHPGYQNQQPYTVYTGTKIPVPNAPAGASSNAANMASSGWNLDVGSRLFYMDWTGGLAGGRLPSSTPTVTLPWSGGWGTYEAYIFGLQNGDPMGHPEFGGYFQGGTATQGTSGLPRSQFSGTPGEVNATDSIAPATQGTTDYPWLGGWTRSRMNWLQTQSANGVGNVQPLQISFWQTQSVTTLGSMKAAYPESVQNPDAGSGSGGQIFYSLFVSQIPAAPIGQPLTITFAASYAAVIANLQYDAGAGAGFVSLPGNATINSNNSGSFIFTPATAGPFTLRMKDTTVTASNTPQNYVVGQPRPAGASILVPQIPNQTTQQTFNVQVAFNSYKPIQANVQYAQASGSPGPFMPLPSNATWDGTGQLLTIPVNNGQNATHQFQVQDTTYAPLLQSNIVTYALTGGGGGTITVTPPIPASTTPTISINSPGTLTEVSSGAGVTPTLSINTQNISTQVFWKVVLANGTDETSYVSAALNANGVASISPLMLHDQDTIRVVDNTTTPTVTANSSPVTIIEVANVTPTMSISAPGTLTQASGQTGVTTSTAITTTNFAGPIYWGVKTSGGVLEAPLVPIAVGTPNPATVAGVSAFAVVSYTGSGPYTYTVTVTNNGNVPLSVFWFAWAPGLNFLVSNPTPSNPSSWTNTVTGTSGAYGIQWVTTSAPIAVNASKAFTFTSADTPAYLLGNATSNTAFKATTSFVYQTTPSVGATASFVAQLNAITTVLPTLLHTGDVVYAANATSSPTLFASSSAVTIITQTATPFLDISDPGVVSAPAGSTSVSVQFSITSVNVPSPVYVTVYAANGLPRSAAVATVLDAFGNANVTELLIATGDTVYVGNNADPTLATVSASSAGVTIIPSAPVITQTVSVSAPGTIMEASGGAGVTPTIIISTTGVSGAIAYEVRTTTRGIETSYKIALPDGAAITVPASIPQQKAAQTVGFQAAFNYKPDQSKIQISVNTTAGGLSFGTFAANAAVATWDGSGQLLTVTRAYGAQSPHQFAVRDISTATPLQSAAVTFNIASSGGGGVVTVPAPAQVIDPEVFTVTPLMLVNQDYIQATSVASPPVANSIQGVSWITWTGPVSTVYTYTVNLLNNGNSPLGTFWFGYQNATSYLPSTPTPASAPSGWTATVINATGAHSIQWVAGTPLPVGQQATFTFTTTDTPAVLFAPSTINTSPAAVCTTSTVWAGAPSTGAQFILVGTDNTLPGATGVSSPVTITDSGGTTPTISVGSPGTQNASAPGIGVTLQLPVSVTNLTGNFYWEVLDLSGNVVSGYVQQAISNGWTQVASDNFTRANTVVGPAGSTTGAGNSWIDVQGGAYNINSNQLVGTVNTHNIEKYLQRPIGEAAQDSRISVSFVYTTTAMNEVASVLRQHSGNTLSYLARCQTATGGSQGNISIFAYTGSSTTLANSGNTTLVNGTNYTLDFSAVGVNPTTLTLTLSNTSTGAQLQQITATDSTSGLQTTGQQSILIWAVPGTTQVAKFTNATTYTGSGQQTTISPHFANTGDIVQLTDSLTSPTVTAQSSPITIVVPSTGSPTISANISNVAQSSTGSGFSCLVGVVVNNIVSGGIFYEVLSPTGTVEVPYTAVTLGQATNGVLYNGTVNFTVNFAQSGDRIQIVDQVTPSPNALFVTAPITIAIANQAVITVAQPSPLNAGLQTINGTYTTGGTPPANIWLYYTTGSTPPQITDAQAVFCNIDTTTNPPSFYGAVNITAPGTFGTMYYSVGNDVFTAAWSGTPIGGVTTATLDTPTPPLVPGPRLFTGTLTSAGGTLQVCLRTQGAAQPVAGNPDVVNAVVTSNPNPGPAGLWSATTTVGPAGVAESFWVSINGGPFSILATLTPTPTINIEQPVGQVATVPYTVMVDFAYVINVPNGGPIPSSLQYSETGAGPFTPIANAPGGAQLTVDPNGNSRIILHLLDAFTSTINLLVQDTAPPGGGGTANSNVAQYFVGPKPTTSGSPVITAQNPLAQQANVPFTAVADFNYLVPSLATIQVQYAPGGSFVPASGLPLGATIGPNPNVTGGSRIVFNLQSVTSANSIAFIVKDTSPLNTGSPIQSQTQFYSILAYTPPTAVATETYKMIWSSGAIVLQVRPLGDQIVSQGFVGGGGPTSATSLTMWTPPGTIPNKSVTFNGTFVGGPPVSMAYSLNGSGGPWTTVLAGNLSINAATQTWSITLPNGVPGAGTYAQAQLGVRDVNNPNQAVAYSPGKWVVSAYNITQPSAGTFVYGFQTNNPAFTTLDSSGHIIALKDIAGTAKILTVGPTTPNDSLGGTFTGANPVQIIRNGGADGGQSMAQMTCTVNSATFDNTGNFFLSGPLGGPNDDIINMWNTSNVQVNNNVVIQGVYLDVTKKYQGGFIWGTPGVTVSFMTAGRWNGGSGTGPFTCEIAVAGQPIIFQTQQTISASGYYVITCQQVGTTFQYRINKGAWNATTISASYAFNATSMSFGGSFIPNVPNDSGNSYNRASSGILIHGTPPINDISSSETFIGNQMGLSI